MLDLDPIKARLDLASGDTHGKWAHVDLVNNAPTDLAALVAEVEHLREEVERLRERQGHYSHVYLAAVEVIGHALRCLNNHKIQTARSTLLMALGSHAGEEPWDVLLEMIREEKKEKEWPSDGCFGPMSGKWEDDNA